MNKTLKDELNKLKFAISEQARKLNYPHDGVTLTVNIFDGFTNVTTQFWQGEDVILTLSHTNPHGNIDVLKRIEKELSND